MDCEKIFSASIIIIIGLVLIDLVPLQQPMTCMQYDNTSLCPEKIFSTSYQDAREKFLQAATAAKAQMESHLILRRGNVDYFMDTAFFPGKKPEKLFVHASGTHGVEGYTGSAIQTKLLREWNETFQKGPSILFVHAINPYGMCHFRRFNENNVDLNRNYLTPEQWAAVKNRDPNVGGYETFRDILTPADAPRLVDRYWFLWNSVVAVARHGFASLKRAFVTGQYHDPQGIFYGGDGEQKSVTVLRGLLKSYSTNIEDAIFLDVHTGLGPYGVDTIMVSNTQDEERSKIVFKGIRVQNDKSATEGPSSGYNLAVGIIHPDQELAGPKTLSVTEEFGTVHPIFVARSIILENAAQQHCNGTYVHEVMRTWVRDAFYPQEIQYKRSTLTRGTEAFWHCVDHLTE